MCVPWNMVFRLRRGLVHRRMLALVGGCFSCLFVSDLSPAQHGDEGDLITNSSRDVQHSLHVPSLPLGGKLVTRLSLKMTLPLVHQAVHVLPSLICSPACPLERVACVSQRSSTALC